MTKTTVIDFAKPSDFSPDPLTDLLRAGARELLATAVRAEVSEFMAGHVHLLDDEGRQRLVRHGFLPEREVITGIGKVAVQVPRVRDRGANPDGSKVRFNSSLSRPICARQSLWRNCFRGFTSKASRRAISARHWLR